MNNKDGTRNKLKRRISVMLLSAAMVITGISVPFVYATGEEAPVTISKTAAWGETAQEKDAGIAKVTLSVNAKNIKTIIPTDLTTRVVLVLDTSSSMNDHDKLDEMKNAAKKFCEDLLAVKNVQIAVIKYGTDVNKLSDFKGADQKETLLNLISNIQKNYRQGTNIQGGIAEAQKLLTGVTADNKIMVVLSDGEPTYSYKGKAAVAADSEYNYDSQTWPYRLTEFDTEIIGLGNSYYLDKRQSYNLQLSTTGKKATIDNNGYGTVSQAYLAKKAGTKIYSVGFDVPEASAAEKVMKSVASASETYLKSETSNLELAFESIKEDVIENVAGSAAVVTDQMGSSNTEFNEYKFTALTDDAHKPQITSADGVTGAEVQYDSTTDTFTWKLTGNELKKGMYTLSYYVKLNLDEMTGDVGKQVRNVETNNSAHLKYTDSSASEQTLNFEKPKLPVTHYRVEYYYSDDSGKTYNKDDSKTQTFAAVTGCSDKTVNDKMKEKGQKAGYDFESEKTGYGIENDANKQALKIKDDETKNVIRLYFKKYEAEGSVSLKAKKIYNALLQGNDFDFSAVKCSNCTGAALEGATEFTAVNNLEGKVNFPEQHFDESDIGKTYYYRITEKPKTDISHISFSNQVYIAEVSIKDCENHDGKLEIETTYYELKDGQCRKIESNEVPSFTNVYSAQPDVVSIHLNKKLANKKLEADQFTFNLTEVDEKGEAVANGVTQTVKNKADGSIDFDRINFTEAKTHYYLITEENGGKEIDRIRYDNLSVRVIVTVEDNGKGKLVTKVDYPGDITFDNTYVKPDTPPTPPPAAKGSIVVTKTVTADGKPACTDRVFHVALFADEQHKTLASAVKEIKMSGNHEASVEFSGLSYGTYYPAETDSSGHALTPEESKEAGFIGTFSQSAIKVSGCEAVHVCLENKLIPDDDPEEPTDPTEPTEPNDPENPNNPGDGTSDTPEIVPTSAPVMTGDESALFVWIPILVITLSALAATIIFRRKAR